MKTLLNVLAITLLVLFSSCENEEIKDLVETPQRLSTLSVENSDNKLDDVGRQHNEALAFILEKKENQYQSKKLAQGELVEIVMEYISGKQIEIDAKTVANMVSHYFEILATGSPITLSRIDICKIYPYICNPGPGPYNPFPTFPTFETSVMTDNHVTNYKNAMDQITAIKAYEANVTKDASLEDEARNGALSYAATYRYSTQFWYNAGNLDDLPMGQESSASPCKSCDVIQADAAGAAVGSLFGPGGAIIGGVLASAVAYDEIYGI
jgi:DNA-directed RNA polymerase subunit F